MVDGAGARRQRRIKVWAVVMVALFAGIIALGLYAAAIETAVALGAMIRFGEWMTGASTMLTDFAGTTVHKVVDSAARIIHLRCGLWQAS